MCLAPITLSTKSGHVQACRLVHGLYMANLTKCFDMYSSKGHIKRLTGAFFLADIQTMTYTQVHRYLGHASMFLLTLHQTMSHSVAKSADQS